VLSSFKLVGGQDSLIAEGLNTDRSPRREGGRGEAEQQNPRQAMTRVHSRISRQATRLHLRDHGGGPHQTYDSHPG